MIYNCCNENRKAAVLGNPSPINGIDYLEVLDKAAEAVPTERQRFLLVYCLKEAPTTLTANNILITGGESITDITCQWLGPANALPAEATAAEVAYFAALANPNLLVVRVNQWGDFSPYTFRLVNNATDAAQDSFQVTEALSGFDPQLAEVTFSFKVQCGPDFDCAPVPPDCPPDLPTPPPINYLAKDYPTFRQVMLDRMNQLLPSWGATSEADIGIMLAELVAYAADQLSYRQDAVTTEAYLLTARSRISLRRHARLVDYFVSEGCNARSWIQVSVTAPTFLDRTLTRFYTSAPGMPASLEVTAGNERAALNAGVVVFEPMQDAELFPEQNSMQIYTWGDTNCCLPQGATEATLTGTFANLQAGDVLIFQEVLGPQTGDSADADIRHRCAVRLTAVATQTASGTTLVDPLFDINSDAITASTQTQQPVTEIQWSGDDALPFAVCVSSQYVNSDGKLISLSGVSVALGNIVLADHGLTLSNIPIGTVPAPSLFYAPNPAADRCSAPTKNPLPVRFRPALTDSPITQAVPLPLVGSPVTATAQPLAASGFVSLSDSNGFTSLMVAAADPAAWPPFFGVLANVNANNAAEFDLSVLFAPLGGPAGMTGNVVLERFSGLSLDPAAANYVGAVLAESVFITEPTPYPPAATVPSTFPTSPTSLLLNGALELKDGGGNTYLTVLSNSPLAWPPLLGVVAQGQLTDPDVFNLLLVFNPSSGANGVSLPVLVEQFPNLSLSNIESKISAASDLIHVVSFEEGPSTSLSASDLMDFSPNEAVPVISLTDSIDTTPPYPAWTAAADLLGSGPDDRNFVMEVDTNGTAYLRFGDGTNGALPQEDMNFTGTYRVGNGAGGNVGSNSLSNFAAGPADSAIVSCTNPLPAEGGVDPETNSQIQTRAPQAFLTQERAVTMQDYVNVVEQNPLIEDAAATLRWTGSWYTVFLTAEPVNNGPLSKSLRRTLTQSVNQYRLAGQDAVIEPPQYVPLQITLAICVDPDYFRLDVQQQLLQALGSGTLPNGRPAYFSPDNFELGQPVYLSPLYVAARAVAGVQTVTAAVFEPQGQNTPAYLEQGYIPMGPFQVAQLANNPSLPGAGRLTLNIMGGK
jgi:Baseplate J-like protein